jgi:hypothetical protein
MKIISILYIALSIFTKVCPKSYRILIYNLMNGYIHAINMVEAYLIIHSYLHNYSVS